MLTNPKLARVFRAYLSVFLFFASSFLSLHSFAQSWDLGGFVGGAAYMGDLNPVNPLKVNNLSFGGQVKRCFNPYWALKLAVTSGKIEAYDADSNDPFARQRNLSFYSSLTEVSLQTEFNFFNYVPSVSKKLYTPFLFAGLGLVGFNPKTKLNGDTYELRNYGTEGQNPSVPYRNYAVTLPFGAGVKFNVKGNWSLIAEAGYRTAFSDYLDDVSKTYPDPAKSSEITMELADRSENKIGFPYSQRGDGRSRDSYMFVGLSLTYSIFKNGCPVVAY